MSEEQYKENGEKISAKKKGVKFSEEHKKSLSDVKKGKSVYWLKGKLNHNWKGGVTPKNKKIRQSIEYSLWRESVFMRDNWICQKCGIRNGNGKTIYLHPHHVKNFAQYPELRFAIDNGITFCKKCHDKFHKEYGRKDNTREQLEEFLLL